MKRFQTSIICSLIIVLVVLACFRSRPNESQAQTQNTPVAFDLETLRESIANFFENMSDNSKGPGRAVDDFLKNSSLAETEKTRTKLAEDIGQYGLALEEDAFGIPEVVDNPSHDFEKMQKLAETI